MKVPDQELRRLVDAWHDGTISREDGARLETRLEREPEASRYFLEIAEIEAALPKAASALGERPANVTSVSFRKTLVGWLRAAATFALGLLCGSLWTQQKPQLSKQSAMPAAPEGARITGLLGVTWDKVAPDIQMLPGASEASFASGLMELTFASGTRTVIEGPAKFQVQGGNAMRLAYGKVVADVPKGAEGFSIDSREGRVVDLGTEFAMEVPRVGQASTLGVFRGKIEFHPREKQGEVLLLAENQAMSAHSAGGRTIPFQRADFQRELPSRDFSWDVNTGVPTTLDFDVSHLIWKGGRYRAVCKWMSGNGGGVVIQSAELLHDGALVVADDHRGFAGDIHLKPDNIYDLCVPEAGSRSGHWILRLKLNAQSANPAQEATARGVVLFDEGMVTEATAEQFAGTWEYLYNGRVYHRTYHLDGTAELVTKEGSAETFRAAKWRVEDGCMILDVPEVDGTWVAETHFLRDSNTLIFANQPYQNAKRIRVNPRP